MELRALRWSRRPERQQSRFEGRVAVECRRQPRPARRCEESAHGSGEKTNHPRRRVGPHLAALSRSRPQPRGLPGKATCPHSPSRDPSPSAQGHQAYPCFPSTSAASQETPVRDEKITRTAPGGLNAMTSEVSKDFESLQRSADRK